MSKSFKTLALMLGALVVAALLATSACTNQSTTSVTPTNTPTPTPSPTVQPGEDEDRPPIIVSGGSVHIRTMAKNMGAGTNNDPGEWRFDKDRKLWSHYHQYLQPAKRLLVHVLYGKDSDSCKKYSTEYNVRELTVNYGIGQHFKISIDAPNDNAAGPVVTDASARLDDQIPFWLDVGLGTDRPTSVELKDDVNTRMTIKCGLNLGKAEIHIYQRINVR